MTDSHHIQGLIDSLAEEYLPDAVQALLRYGTVTITPLLAGLNRVDLDPYAHDTYAEVLVSVLTLTRYRRAVDVLVPLVEHENADVRRRVIMTLGDLADKRVVPVLRVALYDRNDSVRHAAAYSLIKLIYGSEDDTALRAALYDEDDHVRYIAVRTLEFLNATEYILEAARNDVPLIRRIAVYYVGKERVAAGFEMLIDALQDPSDEVCLGAIWSLGQIGNPHATPAIAELVNDPSENVARAAREAMLKLQARSG